MKRELQSILKLRVPVIVRLGHTRMKLDRVLTLGPGAIVELPQQSEQPLDLMVANKVIGQGSAVKIGENFGLRVTAIGTPQQRAQALGPQ
jgi:flagellar motor switch protein FliN/FliY